LLSPIRFFQWKFATSKLLSSQTIQTLKNNGFADFSAFRALSPDAE
jgi:hypothetical protein